MKYHPTVKEPTMNELDCDTLANAIRGCAQNMIERMRESYHRYDPHYADEAATFITQQLGEGDAEQILAEAQVKAQRTA
jgi:hypothetical protein